MLSLCGKELSLAGFDDLAREAYFKMDDFANVLALYVKNQVRFESVCLTGRRETPACSIVGVKTSLSRR